MLAPYIWIMCGLLLSCSGSAQDGLSDEKGPSIFYELEGEFLPVASNPERTSVTNTSTHSLGFINQKYSLVGITTESPNDKVQGDAKGGAFVTTISPGTSNTTQASATLESDHAGDAGKENVDKSVTVDDGNKGGAEDTRESTTAAIIKAVDDENVSESKRPTIAESIREGDKDSDGKEVHDDQNTTSYPELQTTASYQKEKDDTTDIVMATTNIPANGKDNGNDVDSFQQTTDKHSTTGDHGKDKADHAASTVELSAMETTTPSYIRLTTHGEKVSVDEEVAVGGKDTNSTSDKNMNTTVSADDEKELWTISLPKEEFATQVRDDENKETRTTKSIGKDAEDDKATVALINNENALTTSRPIEVSTAQSKESENDDKESENEATATPFMDKDNEKSFTTPVPKEFVTQLSDIENREGHTKKAYNEKETEDETTNTLPSDNYTEMFATTFPNETVTTLLSSGNKDTPGKDSQNETTSIPPSDKEVFTTRLINEYKDILTTQTQGESHTGFFMTSESLKDKDIPAVSTNTSNDVMTTIPDKNADRTLAMTTSGDKEKIDNKFLETTMITSFPTYIDKQGDLTTSASKDKNIVLVTTVQPNDKEIVTSFDNKPKHEITTMPSKNNEFGQTTYFEDKYTTVTATIESDDDKHAEKVTDASITSEGVEAVMTTMPLFNNCTNDEMSTTYIQEKLTPTPKDHNILATSDNSGDEEIARSTVGIVQTTDMFFPSTFEGSGESKVTIELDKLTNKAMDQSTFFVTTVDSSDLYSAEFKTDMGSKVQATTELQTSHARVTSYFSDEDTQPYATKEPSKENEDYKTTSDYDQSTFVYQNTYSSSGDFSGEEVTLLSTQKTETGVSMMFETTITGSGEEMDTVTYSSAKPSMKETPKHIPTTGDSSGEDVTYPIEGQTHFPSYTMFPYSGQTTSYQSDMPSITTEKHFSGDEVLTTILAITGNNYTNEYDVTTHKIKQPITTTEYLTEETFDAMNSVDMSPLTSTVEDMSGELDTTMVYVDQTTSTSDFSGEIDTTIQPTETEEFSGELESTILYSTLGPFDFITVIDTTEDFSGDIESTLYFSSHSTIKPTETEESSGELDSTTLYSTFSPFDFTTTLDTTGYFSGELESTIPTFHSTSVPDELSGDVESTITHDYTTSVFDTTSKESSGDIDSTIAYKYTTYYVDATSEESSGDIDSTTTFQFSTAPVETTYEESSGVVYSTVTYFTTPEESSGDVESTVIYQFTTIDVDTTSKEASGEIASTIQYQDTTVYSSTSDEESSGEFDSTLVYKYTTSHMETTSEESYEYLDSTLSTAPVHVTAEGLETTHQVVMETTKIEEMSTTLLETTTETISETTTDYIFTQSVIPTTEVPIDISTVNDLSTVEIVKTTAQPTPSTHEPYVPISTEFPFTPTLPKEIQYTTTAREVDTTTQRETQDMSTTAEVDRFSLLPSTTLQTDETTTAELAVTTSYSGEVEDISGEIKITNGLNWDPDLEDTNSVVYRNRSTVFNELLSNIFDTSSVGDHFLEVNSISFRQGSVIVSFGALFRPNVPVEDVTRVITEGMAASDYTIDASFTSIKIIGDTTSTRTSTTTTTTTPTTTPSTTTSSTTSSTTSPSINILTSTTAATTTEDDKSTSKPIIEYRIPSWAIGVIIGCAVLVIFMAIITIILCCNSCSKETAYYTIPHGNYKEIKEKDMANGKTSDKHHMQNVNITNEEKDPTLFKQHRANGNKRHTAPAHTNGSASPPRVPPLSNSQRLNGRLYFDCDSPITIKENSASGHQADNLMEEIQLNDVYVHDVSSGARRKTSLASSSGSNSTSKNNKEPSMSTFKQPYWRTVNPSEIKVFTDNTGKTRTYYDVDLGIWVTKL